MKRAMFRAVVLGVAGLGVCVAAGCRNTEKAPYGAKKDTIATTTTPAGQQPWGLNEEPNDARRQYPQIEVLERNLARHITVGEPVVVNGEIMSVTVPIRVLGDTGEFSRIQYQFMFFDEKGVPLRVQNDWRYLRLEARRQEFVRGTSSDTAATWRLRIQLNR